MLFRDFFVYAGIDSKLIPPFIFEFFKNGILLKNSFDLLDCELTADLQFLSSAAQFSTYLHGRFKSLLRSYRRS